MAQPEVRVRAVPGQPPARRPVPRSDRGRVVRGCDVCAQVDDHPRHVHGAAGGVQLAGAVPGADTLTGLLSAAHDAGLDDDAIQFLLDEQLDPETVVRHLDCCRDTGCPDASCAQTLERHGDKRHDALVKSVEAEHAKLNGADRAKHLTALPPAGLTAEQERAEQDRQRSELRAAGVTDPRAVGVDYGQEG